MNARRDIFFSSFSGLLSVVLAVAGGIASASVLESAKVLPILLTGVVSAFAAAATSVFMLRRLKARIAAKKIFFVYSHKDIETATKLSLLLRGAGFRPWLDVEKLLPGQMWKKEIDRALAESGAAIILISENLFTSKYALRELDAVLKQFRSASVGSIPIIPVRVDDTVPPDDFGDIQWLDLRRPDAEEQLLKGLSLITRSGQSSQAGESET
jgi:hypothetical protein